MMKAVVLDACTLGDDVNLASLLSPPLEWEIHDRTALDQRADRLMDADIVLTNKVLLDEDVLSRSPSLKYIGVLATGTNNIDLDYARDKQITVTNVVNYGTHSVAQHAMAMMLSLASALPACSQDVSTGKWVKSDMFCLLNNPVLQLHDKNLLIIGSGTLGNEVARLGQAFGMHIYRAQVPGSPTNEQRIDLDEGLEKAEVVSLHCPLTEQTRNLINAERLQQMKSHALLINTARGGLVDEVALKEALLSGEIRGAGFDVLTEEPPRNGNVLLDESIPNLIITPHTAWASPEARQKLIELASGNLQSFLKSQSDYLK